VVLISAVSGGSLAAAHYVHSQSPAFPQMRPRLLQSDPRELVQSDLLATCAELLGIKLPETAGEDSVSVLPVLLGKDTAPVHEAVVHHSISGRFAIRQGRWKLSTLS
jgi:hypothetical protein